MTKLITNSFKSYLAKQFAETMLHPHGADYYDNIYYVAAHRSIPFINDNDPPEASSSVNATHYSMYDELIFGKHVKAEDVSTMARNIPWVSGTVYDMYDSQVQNLETLNFFVVSYQSGLHNVFKCLNNNGGVPSTSQPKLSETSPDDLYYRTADGYEWKYMYSITPSQYMQFATPAYIPIIHNPAVEANAIPGSIDTIIIESPGSSYRSYATGNIKVAGLGGDPLFYALESSDMTLSSNDYFYENCSIYIDSGPGDGEIRTIIDYYVTGGEKIVVVDSPFETTPNRTSNFIIAPRVFISGDGQNATARAEVNVDDGSIDEIVIINRGSNYTYADIQVVGNTGTTSVAVASSALVRPIIAPPGGHGSDPVEELCSSHVCIGIQLEGDEGDTIPANNEYRKVSLLKNPLFKEADLELNISYASSGFSVQDLLTQESTNASARVTGYNANTVTITNIDGFFETSKFTVIDEDLNTIEWDETTAIKDGNGGIAYITAIDRSFDTFDQRYIYQVDVTNGPISGFVEDEVVVQSGLNQTQTVNLIKITLDGDQTAYGYVDGETVTQDHGSTISSGKVVSRYLNVLTLANPDGYFTVGEPLVGALSGQSVNVKNYDNTISATATGIVHEINVNGEGVGTIALVGVNGTFLLSDDETNTINSFKGQTSQATAKLTGIDSSKSRLIDGSGRFMYIENFVPITRDVDQTERIKLVIEF